MNRHSLAEKIHLIKVLFKGREDVFAIRWEKQSKSGYMPAFSIDKYMYRIYKIKGGSFSDYRDKTYKPLSDDELAKHINGNQFIGIYPLLKDNTSWFLAADFDKNNWTEQCRVFQEACIGKGIPAYIESSRSGNGGHVWIFFEEPLPAIRTRRLFNQILKETGVFSVSDKSSSFDRMFPNQNSLSGKGFGNLIALPFNKHSLEKGNNCFIDINTLLPFENQWKFLEGIRRLPGKKFDELFNDLEGSASEVYVKSNPNKPNGKLTIRLAENLSLSQANIPSSLFKYLHKELNISNSDYYVKKKLGKSVHNIEPFFRLIEEAENEVIIPRGMAGRLLSFCMQNKIDFEFNDDRQRHNATHFPCSIQLLEHQKTAVNAASRKDFGVIVAPPGTGKTIIGLKIIAEKQEPALIIVHRKQLLYQWIDRIQTFLGIPKNEIGKIEQGKSVIGRQITVATIQTLSKELASPDSFDLQNAFGTIIVDECHHIPAKSYRGTIARLNTYFLYGLTATPFRKRSDDKLIFIFLGNVISELKEQQIEGFQQAKVIVRNTELDIPFNSRTDRFETLSQILIHDSARNRLILEDIIMELKAGQKVVVITERKEHIDTLNQFLKQQYETIILCGDDSKSSREQKWKILNQGNYQVLITTGQFFGEGSDLQNVSRLFLAYPFSFKGKLIQYIGRVQRSEIAPVIYDYRDFKIDYLNRLFLKRNTYYRTLEKQRSLFDDPIMEETNKKNNFEIREMLKLSFDELEFRYGSVAFYYVNTDTGEQLEFEIENDTIRPEFTILKSYFSKQLKIRKIEAYIFAEFENDRMVSQLAESKDIDRINDELIESVRFRFVKKEFVSRTAPGKYDMLDLDELQDGQSVYSSEEKLIDELLKDKSVKHYKQILYLVKNHHSDILKIRFVLNPFSFVFLLEGVEQYHLVLETLDTEEATYIWHIDKKELHIKLNGINQDLNFIRNRGRQLFLENPPVNFSRILHDYSDVKKGFISWKGSLEERLL